MTIPSFNSNNDAGIYHVRIQYLGNPNSCINFVVDYQLNAISNNPNAGQNNSLIYCGTQGIINLNSLITGNFDTNGIWTEISTSTIPLVNNFWNSGNAISGNYKFKYTVNNGCGITDEAIINIQIKTIPSQFEIVANNPCSGETVNFQSSQILGATYLWSGPNGFSSNIKNPAIPNSTINNSATYTLSVTLDGCSFSRSLNLTIKPNIDFNLISSCINGAFNVKEVPIQNSFEENNVDYNWTGPNNFSSINNSIFLKEEDFGEYSIEITNTNGCRLTKKLNVTNTSCFNSISLGISPNSDGINDDFDLTGLGKIEKLKIFNRYGTAVFEQENYTNQWQGQDYNGNILPDATYYYHITFAVKEAKVGWIYLNKEVK